MTPAEPARIHLIPAKASPYVLIIRRKPSKVFHIIRWNTRKDTFEHGSWFSGHLYPYRSDISPDGKFMVYLAAAADAQTTWSGVCELPFLKTLGHGTYAGTYFGGGYWRDGDTLMVNHWTVEEGSVPFDMINYESQFGAEDLGVLFPRWERDGWVRRGGNYGAEKKVEGKHFRFENEGDDGWQHRPTKNHPALTVRFIGYWSGYQFKFELEGHEGLFDDHVLSACWDFDGNLVYTRLGVIYKVSLKALHSGAAPEKFDFEHLVPPWDRPAKT